MTVGGKEVEAGLGMEVQLRIDLNSSLLSLI